MRAREKRSQPSKLTPVDGPPDAEQRLAAHGGRVALRRLRQRLRKRGEHVERRLRPALGKLEPREQHGARLLLRNAGAVARLADAAPRERGIAVIRGELCCLQQVVDTRAAARRHRELRIEIGGRREVAGIDGCARALLEPRGIARRRGPLRRRQRCAGGKRREQKNRKRSGCPMRRACRLACVPGHG